MEGNTGNRTVTFTVVLSSVSTHAVTVTYATGNGTALAGGDYQVQSGTLTFAPGETSKTITVLVLGDRLPEPNETFVVNLSSPANATVADGQGKGTIVDDEPRVSISDVSKAEGRKGKTTLFTFTVTLSAAYDDTVTMSFRTENGTASRSTTTTLPGPARCLLPPARQRRRSPSKSMGTIDGRRRSTSTWTCLATASTRCSTRIAAPAPY